MIYQCPLRVPREVRLGPLHPLSSQRDWQNGTRLAGTALVLSDDAISAKRSGKRATLNQG
jgi:hypothetical protein